MLPHTVNAPAPRLRARAARVWGDRRRLELEAASRFARLASELHAHGASHVVCELAETAAADELRHAELCADLSRHFGEEPGHCAPPVARPVAPPGLEGKDALVYEIVAMACVTETLSTALLGSLVERATDSRAASAMRSILRDEVRHSQLGWAYLAEAPAPRAIDAVGLRLLRMLDATLSPELLHAAPDDPDEAALAGLGQLERHERRRVVRETLKAVVFPGLERYGADVSGGQRWCDERLR
jgi:hypothetical protein